MADIVYPPLASGDDRERDEPNPRTTSALHLVLLLLVVGALSALLVAGAFAGAWFAVAGR
jgi:hypothetical protein